MCSLKFLVISSLALLNLFCIATPTVIIMKDPQQQGQPAPGPGGLPPKFRRTTPNPNDPQLTQPPPPPPQQQPHRPQLPSPPKFPESFFPGGYPQQPQAPSYPSYPQNARVDFVPLGAFLLSAASG